MLAWQSSKRIQQFTIVFGTMDSTGPAEQTENKRNRCEREAAGELKPFKVPWTAGNFAEPKTKIRKQPLRARGGGRIGTSSTPPTHTQARHSPHQRAPQTIQVKISPVCDRQGRFQVKMICHVDFTCAVSLSAWPCLIKPGGAVLHHKSQGHP